MAEEQIYSDSVVSITTARVIVSGTTYALRNITSVKTTKTPAKQGCAIMFLLLGILLLIGSVGAFSSGAGTGMTVLLVAGCIVAIAIVWIRACRPTYHVVIASASGEVQALSSQERDYVDKIVGSINDAIVRCR